LVLDHRSREALDAHIRATGDSSVKYLGPFVGKTLRGVFFDSLELAAEFSWTPDFLAEFRRLRGYDLTPLPPFLDLVYDQPEVGGLVRYDYARTVSDLLIDGFYAPFTAWAGRKGLLARIQAHGAPADELRIYGLANIPETENLNAGRRYDFLKLAGSAAHVYVRKITSSESFVWLMEEYQTTPEKLKRSADGMLAAGVNRIVASGFPYE